MPVPILHVPSDAPELVAGLRRILDTDVSRIVDILRPAMEQQSYAGRALFAGLRSLPFPADPLGQLDGNAVKRPGECLAQADIAVKFVLVVAR